jgi:oligopeptidase B
MGLLSGRQKTNDAFLKCVRHIKTTYKLKPENIVIYGRSAGGLLVGGSLNEVPDGSLFGGIFTEVAYLDELRTTTNPELPLTQLEYNEFGNPSRSIEEFLSVGLLSPANSAVTLKTPNVFIYAKTATNDTQVYAYESVKWIDALRGKGGEDKLVAISGDQGHFTRGDELYSQRAADYLLLLKRIFG